MKTIIAFLLLTSTAFAQAKVPDVIFRAPVQVVSVVDGDTVNIVLQGKQRRVRLEGIDAPEAKQDYSDRAKQALSEMLIGKDAEFALTGIDRYGRLLGKFSVEGRDVNLEMIRQGMAWHYAFYNSEAEYVEAQIEAREKQIGLWSLPDPVEPYEFRKRK